ncbi:MAG: hypothetical protein IPO21_17145 [Bacteroidales bacterium]|nr:hypothetical protein [Bacteroidales bacterium]
MNPVQIKLTALWVMLMFTYLLGDVIRIFAGDFVPGEIAGKKISQMQWLGIAAFMLLPIIMIFLTLILPLQSNRWVNIIMALILFLFNLIGLPSYPSAYDKFLIVFGLIINCFSIWYAWNWI